MAGKIAALDGEVNSVPLKVVEKNAHLAAVLVASLCDDVGADLVSALGEYKIRPYVSARLAAGATT